MADCTFQLLLSAYYDDELDAGTRSGVEEHLQTCPTCAAEMTALRQLSGCIASASVTGGIEPGEVRAMHRAVDRAAVEQSDVPLLRIAGFFSAVAASVLIISGVWLMELHPVTPTAASGRQPVALAPEWERVAMTLHADPRPGLIDDSRERSLFSPRYAAAVDWMLSGLTSVERKPWAKPNSF